MLTTWCGSFDSVLNGCMLQEPRMMSIIVAKNAVGSSWRKTVGSREWSHVPGAMPFQHLLADGYLYIHLQSNRVVHQCE